MAGVWGGVRMGRVLSLFFVCAFVFRKGRDGRQTCCGFYLQYTKTRVTMEVALVLRNWDTAPQSFETPKRSDGQPAEGCRYGDRKPTAIESPGDRNGGNL